MKARYKNRGLDLSCFLMTASDSWTNEISHCLQSFCITGIVNYLGIHVRSKHVFIIIADCLISPQIISHLSPAELDTGAGDHSREVRIE